MDEVGAKISFDDPEVQDRSLWVCEHHSTLDVVLSDRVDEFSSLTSAFSATNMRLWLS